MADALQLIAAILIIAGLVVVFDRFESFARQFFDQPLGDDSYGDWPAVPDDLKLSHHANGDTL